MVLRNSSLKYSVRIVAHVIEGLTNELIIGYPSMKDLNIGISPGEGSITIFNSVNLRISESRYCLKMLEGEDSTEDRTTKLTDSKMGNDKGLNKKILTLLNEACELLSECKIPLKHDIELKENSGAIYCKPYRRSERGSQVISNEISNLLERKIIRESISSFASPAVIIKKEMEI